MKLLTGFLSKTAFAVVIGALSLSGCAGQNIGLKLEATRPEDGMRVVVLPLDNLSATAAPVAEIRKELVDRLPVMGLYVSEEDALAQFMAKYRIRYTGGIDDYLAQAFRKEMHADAVLITSLELYDESFPPKIALTSRLVSTGEKPEIFWMESVGVSGDDAPGLLGLGLMADPKQVREKALTILMQSLERYFSDTMKANGVAWRYGPKLMYNALTIPRGKRPSIAIIPFFNQSTRKNAGEIEVLHFVKQLVATHKFEIVEPGVVRDRMLKMRIILDDGISLPRVDLIANYMEVDYVLAGKVFDYQDFTGVGGTPKIDFSVQLLERASKKIVWASKSYNEGDDGVFFFDWGRLNTANVLAEKMTKAIVTKLFGK